MQCAHAALRAVEFSTASHPDELNYWYIHAQPKVVVKADNSYELWVYFLTVFCLLKKCFIYAVMPAGC